MFLDLFYFSRFSWINRNTPIIVTILWVYSFLLHTKHLQCTTKLKPSLCTETAWLCRQRKSQILRISPWKLYFLENRVILSWVSIMEIWKCNSNLHKNSYWVTHRNFLYCQKINKTIVIYLICKYTKRINPKNYLYFQIFLSTCLCVRL